MKIVHYGLGFGLGFIAAANVFMYGLRRGYTETGSLDWLEDAVRSDLTKRGKQVPGMSREIYEANDRVFQEFARDPLGFDRGLRD